jgi:hypothetical protein
MVSLGLRVRDKYKKNLGSTDSGFLVVVSSTAPPVPNMDRNRRVNLGEREANSQDATRLTCFISASVTLEEEVVEAPPIRDRAELDRRTNLGGYQVCFECEETQLVPSVSSGLGRSGLRGRVPCGPCQGEIDLCQEDW